MLQVVWTEDRGIVLRNDPPSPFLLAVNHDRLEAAVAQPSAGFGDFECYPSLFQKAAVLARGLICDHCFTDGNKRTGMVAAAIFLGVNGYRFRPPWEKVVELARLIAIKRLTVAHIAQVIERYSEPLDRPPQQLRFPGFPPD